MDKFLCRKCNSLGTITIRKVYLFCENCFIANIIHKFRSCIGKNTKLNLTDKALVCLSGGIASTVLLDLIINGISLNSHKKLRIIPIFLHITGIEKTDKEVTNSIIDQCKSYNVEVHIVNIGEFTSTENNDVDFLQTQYDLNNLSPTTKIDHLAKIKQKIFYKVAKELECNLIFTAETNTKLSEKLLSNIVTGRGSQIENDIGFCDARDNDVKLLRPMREITKEELDHYVKIKQIPANSTNNAEINSLQSVISKFILDLQENTPATISTICKTADKIGSEKEKSKKYCAVCQNDIDAKPAKLTAVAAIAYSKMLSSGRISNTETIKLENDLSDISMFPHIYQSLCYGCSRNYCEIDILK